MDNLREEAIDYLSKKYNLSHKEVAEIVKSQFTYAKMRIKNFEEVKLRYFGSFLVKEWYADKIDTIKENRLKYTEDEHKEPEDREPNT